MASTTAPRTGNAQDESGYSSPQAPLLAGSGPALLRAAIVGGTDADCAMIGELASVRGLMRCGRGQIELSELGVLQLPIAHISSRHARRLSWQLVQARQWMEGGAAAGIGIAAPGQAGLVRGFAAARQPLILTDVDGSWISAERDGLLVCAGGPRRELRLVRGWQVSGDGVIAQSEDGRWDLRGRPIGALLIRLAPTLSAVETRQVALTTIFAGLLATLADLSATAAARDARLLVERSRVSH
ncbi:MAG: hypothetical protein JWN95_3591 [Frankiales bacterium]|nr:hypothetical protein [Frankiales bacterium]